MKRSIDTSIWGDPWFIELSATGKMVFMYLLTNERSTAAGIFDLAPRRMAFDIGIDQSVAESALEECSERVRWWPDHSIVWVVNFFRHQAVNDNFLKSAQRTFEGLPEEIRKEVVGTYPEFDKNPSGTRPEPVPTGKVTSTHIDKSEELTAKSDQVTEQKTPNPLEPKPTKPKSANPASSDAEGAEHPFALFEAMCETLGVNTADLTKPEKGKQLAVAKRLAESGVTAKETASITRWLKSHDWRTGGIDMFLVEKERSKWVMEGKPDGAKPAKTNPVSEPRGYSHDPDEARQQMHRELAEMQREALGDDSGRIISMRRESA